MEFIDLKTQYSRIEENVHNSFGDILRNARFIMGKEIKELELELSEYVGVKHCITCSSGTDAILLALMAANIKKGDAVFVPSFTFFASAEVIAVVGATPIFIDVREDTFNIDVHKLEEAITEVIKEGKLLPKMVIPVDLFGQAAEYDEIKKVASKYGLIVLEDAAQGFGGEIDGKKACGFGDISATSFFPAKPLGCYGDGGAVFTDNDEFAEIIRSIRIHGQGKNKYENVRLGMNGRLDTLQAAVLIAKLKIFDEELILRNNNANAYSQLLEGYLDVPAVLCGYRSSWAQYTLKAKDGRQRDEIVKTLGKKGIPTAIYYPIPLHKQKVFSSLKTNYCDLSTSNDLANRVLSLPMHPYLQCEDIEQIANTIIEVV